MQPLASGAGRSHNAAMLIEIYSDLICPWCYIGLHRIDRALAERPGRHFERRWMAFELNPDMPPAGMDRISYLAAKFGGLERARQIYSVIEESAERDGIPLTFDRVRRTPSTRDAHRLVRHAARQNLADAMTRRLFQAYFVEGRDIGDRDVLVELAGECGLDSHDVRHFLAGDGELAVVRANQAAARQLGIQAVPCFIFGQRFALAGAQEPGTFLPLLDLALEAEPALNTTS